AEMSRGSESPPDNTEPIQYLRTSPASFRASISTCVICPTFSSIVMRESRSSTRAEPYDALQQYSVATAHRLALRNDNPVISILLNESAHDARLNHQLCASAVLFTADV